MRKAGDFLSLLIKVLMIAALVAVGLFVYSTCAGGPIIQKIDKTLPDIAAAPFDVSTATVTYKAEAATLKEDGSVSMSGWYVRDDKKWVYHEETVELPPLLLPSISRR